VFARPRHHGLTAAVRVFYTILLVDVLQEYAVVDLSQEVLSVLGMNTEQLQQVGGHWTATEIAQQPKIWREIAADFASQQPRYQQWLLPLLQSSDLRIILTGAGTSAYIGQTLLPHLLNQLPLPGQRIEAISTTDLVSHPQQWLNQEQPTLLISYGRSGNSPESLAAVELLQQNVRRCFHLIITCNAQGQLADFGQRRDNALVWLLPDACHDRSFAMTSSFTGMLLATLLLFAPNEHAMTQSFALTEQVLRQHAQVRALAQTPCQRIVFLGGGCLTGIAREAALKYLELTAGQILSYYESPLGFRHGPKSMVDEHTQILILMGSNHYSQQYDQDLYQELLHNGRALSVEKLQLAECKQAEPIPDVWIALPTIVYCQMLALFKALQLNVSPDNPCPSGEVNRVVQGVTIYPFTHTEPVSVLGRAVGKR
jgi:tagatose-6-phosphate ketose/aldose isomerase